MAEQQQSEAFLIWASRGEYSDRREWPIAVMFDRADAEAATVRLGQLWGALCSIYRVQEDALDAAGDWMGDTLFDTTEEGREYKALTGCGVGDFTGYGEEQSYTCDAVPIWSAATLVAALASAQAAK
jgi:hypothetical protein